MLAAARYGIRTLNRVFGHYSNISISMVPYVPILSSKTVVGSGLSTDTFLF